MLEFHLPYKVSNPIDFSPYFKTYFITNYGNDALFKEFSGFFSECTNLRRELDYAQIAQQVKSNQKVYDDTEQKIIKFLRYEYLLDKSFVFQTGQKTSLNLSFSWYDSLNISSLINISNMKYEIAGHLYNFALNEYFNSIKLMSMPELQQKKLAIAKFKVGSWALVELKSFLPIILSNCNNVKLPSDFNRNFLTIMENLMIGLAYFCFLDIHEKNESEFGTLNIATIANEASKSFKIALDLLTNDKTLPLSMEMKKQLHTSLYILYSISFSYTCMKLAIYYENLHADDQTKGYLGLSISYFKAGAKVVQSFFQQKYDLSAFPGFLKDRLMNHNIYFSQGNSKNEARNTQIYKQKVYNDNELPQLADINPQIKIIGTKPSLFDKPFEYANVFDVITNPELQKDAENLRGLFEKKKKELEDDVKKTNEKKVKAYVDSYVNYLLDKTISNTSQGGGLPKSLDDKRKNFISKGGMGKLSNAITSLKENAFNCQMLLDKIKETLTTERNEDMKMKSIYQGNWSRMSSDSLNQEYWRQVNDLMAKLKIAQGIDGQIGSKFSTYSKYGETLAKSPEELLKLFPLQNTVDASANNEILSKIQGTNAEIIKDFEELKGIISNFSEEFSKMNLSQEVINGKKNNCNANDIFSKVVNKTLFPFPKILEKILGSIEEICKLANVYNSSQKNQSGSSADAKVLEDLTNGAMNLCELYDDVDQGMKFYQGLFDLLLKLDKNVEDFCCAREMEKSALLQEITQRAGSMNFQGGFNPYQH